MLPLCWSPIGLAAGFSFRVAGAPSDMKSHSLPTSVLIFAAHVTVLTDGLLKQRDGRGIQVSRGGRLERW